ncbi:MAG: hypothetical protein ACTSRG_15655 [Candidatus Helarchaeota archaeon]
MSDIKNITKCPPQTPIQRLFWEIIFLIPIIITVSILGYAARVDVIYTEILSLVFGINLIIRFLIVNEKGDWIFFLFGVIAGGGNDLMSMMNNVYNYTSKTIFPFLTGLMPFWMILFWGQVFLLFRKIFYINILKGEDFQQNGKFLKGWIDKKLIFDICVIICLRFVIYQIYMLDFWIPALIYGCIICFRFAIFHPKENELRIMGILPYAFTFEGLMVLFGLYIYINPILAGLPLWLLLWWIFLVPIVLKEIFDRIEYYLHRNKG